MKKFTFVLLIFSLNLFAAWSPEIKVTAPDGYMDRVPEIVVDKDGTVWVFWYGLSSSAINFYYSKWLGNGFSPESLLNTIDNNCGSPFSVCINQYGYPSVAWPAAFYSKKDKSALPIEKGEGIAYFHNSSKADFYGLMRSTFNGSVWLSDTVDSNGIGWSPDIAVNSVNGETWIVAFKDDQIGWWRWTGIWSVGYVNTSGISSENPSIVLEGNNPLVVWYTNMEDANSDTTGEIAFSRWMGYGFNPETLITQDTCLDFHPQVKIAPDGTPWLVWYKYLRKYNGGGYWIGKWAEVYYSRYISGLWTTPAVVNTPDTLNDKFPTITFNPLTHNPVVVWCGQDEGGDYQIYKSEWDGVAWSPEEKITEDTRNNYWPEAAFDSTGHLWIVYEKDNHNEIYAKYTLLKNASILSIECPPESLKKGSSYTPEIICANNGDITENFYTHFIIYDSLNNIIYIDSLEVLNLMPGSVDTVQFNNWLCNAYGTYKFISYTNLIGDEYSLDDTLLMNAYCEPTVIEDRGIPLSFSLSVSPLTADKKILDVFYALPEKADVIFRVYDVGGRTMKRVVRRAQGPGYYHLFLNTAEFSAGIYFINAKCGKENRTVKFIIVK